MQTHETNPSNDHSRAERPSGSQAWVPDWAPWGMLGFLVLLGLLGGLGVLRVPSLKAAPAASSASTKLAPPNGAAPVSAAPVSAGGAVDPETLLGAAHLVVTHAGTPFGKHKNITRTREEAKQRAEEARARALKGEDFGALALEFSDEPDAKTTKGDLGTFRYKGAVKPFADATIALKVGEISPVVETGLGFHVIKRTK